MPKKNKTRKDKVEGTCQLTGLHGFFVDSHLIPEALTKPATKGDPMFQYGQGERPKRRWTSWYDSSLVIAEGEKYLSDLDNWAIPELRKHKLVWSGWGNSQNLEGHYNKVGPGFGVRKVAGIDPKRLRLFFLSLLWRAAKTTLPEFLEVSLPEDDLEKLKKMIVSGDPNPTSFYSCQLTQLSTKGVIHNQSPFKDVKSVPGIKNPDGTGVLIHSYRFYFDGLIAHMNIALPESFGPESIGSSFVGSDSSLVVSVVPYESSLQQRNLREVILESVTK